MNSTTALAGAVAAIAAAGSAGAAVINVTANISTPTTWTANNTYNLVNQIYVLPGATLTIEPGTLIASTPTANGAGSLAVTRGAKIFVKGTAAQPVIMTSTNDNLTTWREAANEWGNLTIMGNAYISNSFVAGNTKTCGAGNLSPMEGLVPDFVGDPKTLYGGGDDDDDSGCINFLSLRYGGRVVGLNNELNGLSLGGIGRETDIQFVDIMNNVDDGIEIWGGTVNIKYFNIWNIGDDCFDVDQGWRGKAQFGLNVQGYCLDAAPGSGVGDMIFELDGAEDSDAQPVTTAAIYNVTTIGQPLGGKDATNWRDNARVQFRNSIFMDLGRDLVRDGFATPPAQGYGFNGTLTFAQTWATSAAVFSPVNACPNAATLYQAQDPAGKLAEIKDSVFFRNLFVSGANNAYTAANAVGVLAAANNNVLIPGFAVADEPIVSIGRAAPVTKGGTTQLRVTSIDPRAKVGSAAATSVGAAPNDGFYTPAQYRGGFSTSSNWLCGWTAADAYGFVVKPVGVCNVPTITPCEETPTCITDINQDGVTDGADLGILLGQWGGPGSADFTGSGQVDGADLGILLGAWGPCL